jgi:hypothetical protein
MIAWTAVDFPAIEVARMEANVPIQLVLVDPPAGVDYGVQKGSGAATKRCSFNGAGKDTQMGAANESPATGDNLRIAPP